MDPIDELRKVATAAVRYRRKCQAWVMFSGLLGTQVALSVVASASPGISAELFLLLLAVVFFISLLRLCSMNNAFKGLEFSSWSLYRPITVRPRPAQSLDAFTPLPHWIIPEPQAPAPFELSSAVEDMVEGDATLQHKRAECIEAHGGLTVRDAVNLIYAAGALKRWRSQLAEESAG